jgi:hypothetical protein
MKIWLFHPVCRLLYLVCAVSRSEVLASVLCFRLGLVWRFCFTTADFSWLVLLLATRSASLASSFSPWSTRSFQSLFSGSEIFGFSLLSEVRCQDFVLYSVHLVLADFLHRSVSLLSVHRSDPEEFPSREPARRPIYVLSVAGYLVAATARSVSTL